LVVRSPDGGDEVDAFFRMAAAVFEPDGDPASYVGWLEPTVNAPDFAMDQIRCVYRDGQLVGGCIVHSRRLRAGPARLSTGCIGAVATRSEHRKQGVASSLLDDILARARADGVALLLLDGISNFYDRFGYVDVFDAAWHKLERSAVRDLPPSPYSVRQATKDDARQLLDLYDRCYGPYLGSFERSLDRQRHELPASPERRSPLLAVSPDGKARGYLAVTWDHAGARADEVGADDWPAVVALLQAQEGLVAERPDAPEEIWWPLPATSPAFHLLADHLPLRTEVHRELRGGWQARVGDGNCLLSSLVPLWRANWAGVRGAWQGVVEIRLGDSGALALDLRPGALEVAEAGRRADARVDLEQGAFLKLLFGERDLAWAAAQPGSDVPVVLLPTLARLLAAPPAWIPGTDSF
jgi:GNAT superfamily N-acetyltransferase